MMKKTKKIISIAALSVVALYSVPVSMAISNKIGNNYISVYNNGTEVYKKSTNKDYWLLDGQNSDQKAQIITLGFYKEALYGFDYNTNGEDQNINNPTNDSIMGKYPGFTTKIGDSSFYTDYHKANTLVNIGLSLKSEDVTLSSYVAELAQTNTDPEFIAAVMPVIASEYDSLKDWIDATGNGDGYITESDIDSFYEDDAFLAIDNSFSFDLSAAEFMFQTMFLFQESSNSSYDYRLTEELVAQKPMFVWSADLHNTILLGADKQAIEDANTISEIYDIYNTNPNLSTSDIDVDKKADTLDMGYQGIVNQSNSTLPVNSDFWNYSNSWNFLGTDNEDEWTQISNSTFTQSVDLNNTTEPFGEDGANWWIEDGQSKINVKTTEEDGTQLGEGYVLHAISLYPFIFGYNYNEDTQSASKFYYSIEASYDESNQLYNKTTTDDENSIDLLEAIFTDINNSPKEKEIITVYVINSLISNNSKLILNSQQYWRNRGYYIELSGKFKTIYGDLIAPGIQKLN